MVRDALRVDYPVGFGLAIGWSERAGAGRMREVGWHGALVVDSDWVPGIGDLLTLAIQAHGPSARPLHLQGLVIRRGPRCFWLQFLTLERELTLLMRHAGAAVAPPRARRSGGA